MTIWLLTVVLLASLAGLGYRQGVVRVAFSLMGILMGALLAVPLGHLLRPIGSALGMKNPVLLWMIPPFIIFALVLALFKIAGLAAHKKLDVYYKYRAGELRFALWERLYRRLGLCLGLLNGLAYLIIISFVIYIFSYWTIQISSATSESRGVRILNALGRDLENTGLEKVARAVDRMPSSYYETADTAGLLFHTPQLGDRLALYPAFLGLGERPEFQALAADAGFQSLRQQQSSIVELLKNPRLGVILKNPDLLKTIWATLETDQQDLNTFLTTGESPKYGAEKIVGRWSYDLEGSAALLRKLRPTLNANQVAQLRRWMAVSFARASFVATPQQEILLKNIPPLKAVAGAPATQLQTWPGQWKKTGVDYELTVNTGGATEAARVGLEGDRLAIVLEGTGIVFLREN